MPYNKKTAIANQKAFLQSQAQLSDHPNIQKRAKEQLAKLEKYEKEQAEFEKKIREFNARHEQQRKERQMTIKPRLGRENEK